MECRVGGAGDGRCPFIANHCQPVTEGVRCAPLSDAVDRGQDLAFSTWATVPVIRREPW